MCWLSVVQETRKATGLEVSDRISLAWAAEGELADAIAQHAELIADEVLATTMVQGDPGDGWTADGELGLAVQVQRA